MKDLIQLPKPFRCESIPNIIWTSRIMTHLQTGDYAEEHGNLA